MIRVAFPIDVGWIGGLNYYRNLLLAIKQVEHRRIEPVIVVGKQCNPEVLADLPGFRVLQTSLLDSESLLSQTNARVRGNLLLRWVLRMHGISVMSHTTIVGLGRIRTIGWIPDFQHRHLPHLFSAAELNGRDSYFMDMAMFSSMVLVSSENARRDFVNFAPDHVQKVRVLRFLSVPAVETAPTLRSLQMKYGFDRSYFFLPNQFWVHKNHGVVVEALASMRERTPDVLVISTGSTNDHRSPSYFEGLLKKIKKAGVSDSFRILGVVPYQDVVGLMMNAIAMINPSLFEGWSTSVEEARTLRVPMLLSDIEVHVEQAGNDATYFSATDSNDLASAMTQFLENAATQPQTSRHLEGIERNQSRLAEYGERYQEIVLELMSA